MTWIIWVVCGWALTASIFNLVRLLRLRKQPPFTNADAVTIDVRSVGDLADWRIRLYDMNRNVWFCGLIFVGAAAWLLFGDH